MSSTESSEKRPEILQTIKRAALSRWKLETLTGLLGFRAMQHHQSETERNTAAENRHVRKKLWGDDGGQSPAAEGDDMRNQTILGDYTAPTPIVIAPQPQSSGGLGKVLAGAALGAAMIGIPGAAVAGFALSHMLNKPAPVPAPTQPANPTTDESLDIGLGRFSDLLP